LQRFAFGKLFAAVEPCLERWIGNVFLEQAAVALFVGEMPVKLWDATDAHALQEFCFALEKLYGLEIAGKLQFEKFEYGALFFDAVLQKPRFAAGTFPDFFEDFIIECDGLWEYGVF
jgi:hypothetical protein